jgi:hypothetical protein
VKAPGVVRPGRPLILIKLGNSVAAAKPNDALIHIKADAALPF